VTKLVRHRATRAALTVALVAVPFVALDAPAAHADPISDIFDQIFPGDGPGNGQGPGNGNEGPGNGNGNEGPPTTDTTVPDTTEPSTDPTTTPTTAPETTAPTTEAPTTSPTTAGTTTSPPTNSSTTGGSVSAGGGAGPSGPGTPGATGGPAQATAAHRSGGFLRNFAPFLGRARNRHPSTKLNLTAPGAATATNGAGVAGRTHKTTASTADGEAVNASAARSLRDATRADTHDRSMPSNLRIGLIAFAALLLLAVLLMPRAPALLFTRRTDHDGYPRGERKGRRAGVATMTAGTNRRP
jgi:hypothetical protein